MHQTKQKSKHVRSADNRRRDLAKIHIAKKQLGMDDETYRDMLYGVAGVRSAADLDGRGRIAVIGHHKSLGFEVSHKRTRGYKSVHSSAKASGMHIPSSPERAPLLSKIGAILADLKLPWSYADSIAKHMYQVDKVRWLYPDQLRSVVVALVKRQQKATRETEAIYD